MIKGMFNVEVACTGSAWLARFEDAVGNRYHVWFDPETYGVRNRFAHGERGRTLFKNPPSGLKRGDHRYFDTRMLDATNKSNEAVVQELLDRVKAEKLVEKKQAELDAVEAEKRAKLEAEERLWMIKNAGPQLLEALQFARSVIEDGKPWDDECEQIINGAIEKATTG